MRFLKTLRHVLSEQKKNWNFIQTDYISRYNRRFIKLPKNQLRICKFAGRHDFWKYIFFSFENNTIITIHDTQACIELTWTLVPGVSQCIYFITNLWNIDDLTALILVQMAPIKSAIAWRNIPRAFILTRCVILQRYLQRWTGFRVHGRQNMV